MEHQDTKLTSMRPRLKELNDNPYILYHIRKGYKTKIVSSPQMLRILRRRGCFGA